MARVFFRMTPVAPGAGVISNLAIDFFSRSAVPLPWQWRNNGQMTTFDAGKWRWEPGFPNNTAVVRLYHNVGGAVQATLERDAPWTTSHEFIVGQEGDCVTGPPVGFSVPDFRWRITKVI